MSENLRFSTNIDPANRVEQNPLEALAALGSDTEALKGFLTSHTYIQRDTGDIYKCLDLATALRGPIALLQKDSDSNVKMNLNLSEFVTKLKTPGSPWSLI